jgi:hypothetical protein
LQEQIDYKNITNDDVLGDEIPRSQQDDLCLLCYQLLEITPSVGTTLLIFFEYLLYSDRKGTLTTAMTDKMFMKMKCSVYVGHVI